jgi:NTE family protein
MIIPYLLRVVLASAVVFVGACRQRPPREDAPPVTPPPVVVTAPTPPPHFDPPPPPPVKSSHRVAVILGPGGAKAFAHVGVLKALQKQRVPIDKVVGLEWGALVGGLFAHHGQLHDVEWKLYKLEQQNLPRPKGFFARSGTTTGVKVMDPFLSEAFGRDDLSSARIKFTCPTRSLFAGVVGWQDRGSWRDVVKRCLSFPPTFTVEGSFFAGASQAQEAVDLLKREGYDVILLVNVLGSAAPTGRDGNAEDTLPTILWQEVRRATLLAARAGDVETIEVNTNAYPILQFESARELGQLGETAGTAAATRLISKFGF